MTTTAELALEVLRQHAAAFAEHAPEVRPDGDPEHVHAARVATRRLRAALRLFEDALPPELDGLHDQLGWVASELGPIRDLDVQGRRVVKVGTLLGVGEALEPYGAWLEAQRGRAFVKFSAARESPAYMSLVEHLAVLDSVHLDGSVAIEEDAPRRMRRAYRQLGNGARDLEPTSEPSEFHKVRIRAKRLRYTTEFFSSLYGKPGERLIEVATALQDLLGDHQDGIVNTEHVHEAVKTAAGTWPTETALALGQMIQWEANHGAEIRANFGESYQEVKRSWKDLRL